MFRNETFCICFTLLLASGICSGQKTWWGEVSGFAGGGDNEIFRFQELEESETVTGTGLWTAGMDLRKLLGDHFSLGTGLSYSHQYYTSPASGIGGADTPGSFGLVTVPVMVRADFLKWFFADAGALLAMQTGIYREDNMSGLGATLGAGIQYRFRSDIFIRVRAFATQYGLLHFSPGNHPLTPLNGGVTVGVGYRFIRLGSCNCPDDKNPVRKFR